MSPTPNTVTVPVSNPAHPSHATWLQILLKVLEAATTIGPAVVAIASPGNAQLAQQAAQIAVVAESAADPSLSQP